MVKSLGLRKREKGGSLTPHINLKFGSFVFSRIMSGERTCWMWLERVLSIGVTEDPREWVGVGG